MYYLSLLYFISSESVYIFFNHDLMPRECFVFYRIFINADDPNSLWADIYKFEFFLTLMTIMFLGLILKINILPFI